MRRYLDEQQVPGMKEIGDYALAVIKNGDEKAARAALLKYEKSGIHLTSSAKGRVGLPKVGDLNPAIVSLNPESKVSIYPKIDLHGEIYLEVINEGETRYFRFVGKDHYIKARLAPGMDEIKTFAIALLSGENEAEALGRLLQIGRAHV